MAVSRAALSREIAKHPGRPIWAATDTTSGDLICCAWRRLRGSSPVASAVRYSRFGWVYVHWFGHGLRARVDAFGKCLAQLQRAFRRVGRHRLTYGRYLSYRN